jgi:NAD(P)-dependent dehydrogenase (short-subunit alcohol dehydrogenase family)
LESDLKAVFAAHRHTSHSMAAERDLRGAVALVTGGTKGIGAELVAQLSARGARIISLSRSLPNSSEAVEGVDYRQCDIGDVRATARC